MQFFGRRCTAYVFITADIRITFDRAGTVDSLVIRDVGIAGNRRIVQIRVTGYVEVRRIRRAADGLIAFDRLVLINGGGIRDVQFFGRRCTAYVFITADIRITFDRAGTVDSLVIRDVGIAGNRRIVQIRVTGYVEVRRIRRAADGLVAFDRRRAVGCGIAFRFGATGRRLITIDRLVAVDILNQIFDNLLLFITKRTAFSKGGSP